MALGIGLHCWYCEHGPCNNTCIKDIKNKKVMNIRKEWISLLNFEGDVFKIIKGREHSLLFDIIDYKGQHIKSSIPGVKVLEIYDGRERIKTSEGILYNIGREHSNAKPSREELLSFLQIDQTELKTKKSNSKKNVSMSFTLSDRQQALYDEWIEAIKKIHGEYGHFRWTISPTGIGKCIEVQSSLTNTILDLTDVDDW